MTTPALLGAAALLAAAPSPAPAAHAAAHHHRARAACPAPSHLRLARKLGKTTAMLRWKGIKHRKTTFRVIRDRHVVGQTTRRRMRVAVRLGHTHRFTVAIVHRGRMGRCRATRRIKVRYHVPGAPRQLTVTGGEGGLTLRWKRGERGDARLAGYRVLRNGATLGQTKRRRWQLGASANHRYRFAVVAVDRRGHKSRPSRSVTMLTGHAAPTTPGSVRAVSVSDSQVGVTWSPSHVRSGRITGYRVTRNGAVVGQTSSTSFMLSHLAPSTDYQLSVTAIDNLGAMSKPSAPVTARTANPVQSTGGAQAYLLASTDQSFIDFQQHYQQIGEVYPTYFQCTGDGAIEGRDDPLITRWAGARGVKVMPRINCQRAAVVDRILTDPTTRQQWLDQLMAMVANDGYAGISLDFEAGSASNRAAMTSFVSDLAARLHAVGKLLTVAASPKTHDILDHPRSGIFDYPAISQSADWVFVMAWGLHWATSVPGAQDDIAWVRQIASYVATMPLKRKFIFGQNLYAIDWPAGGGAAHPGTAYEYQDIVSRLPSLGATPVLDPATDNVHATYVDGDGVEHDVWYPDAGTSAQRIAIARANGLGGVGFWRLGREDQALWSNPALAPGASW